MSTEVKAPAVLELEPLTLQLQISTFVVDSYDQLPVDVTAGLNTFLIHENDKLSAIYDNQVDENRPLTSEELEQQNAVLNHDIALSGLSDAKEPEEQLLLVVTCDRTHENRITGFASAFVNPLEQSTNSLYIGASSDPLYRGKVAIRTLAVRDMALLRMGITSYTTDVWPRSLKLQEKLGETFQVIEQPTERFNRSTIKVSLIESELRNAYERIDLDPNTNPLEQSYEVEVT